LPKVPISSCMRSRTEPNCGETSPATLACALPRSPNVQEKGPAIGGRTPLSARATGGQPGLRRGSGWVRSRAIRVLNAALRAGQGWSTRPRTCGMAVSGNASPASAYNLVASYV
jgi:hypothetical protein